MTKTMKKLILVFIGLFLLQGCMYAIRYDGTYSGKIVDADTGAPIEGVVVLGVWNVVHHGPAGGVAEYYDARETVTDKNGEFSVPGMGLRVMSNLEPMSVVIFKAGYEHLGYMLWESLKVDILLKKKIIWEGSKAIIPLKKLTMKERMRNVPPLPPGEAPYKKIRLMLDEYNKNSKELGLGIIDVWRDMK